MSLYKLTKLTVYRLNGRHFHWLILFVFFHNYAGFLMNSVPFRFRFRDVSMSFLLCSKHLTVLQMSLYINMTSILIIIYSDMAENKDWLQDWLTFCCWLWWFPSCCHVRHEPPGLPRADWVAKERLNPLEMNMTSNCQNPRSMTSHSWNPCSTLDTNCTFRP